MPTDHLNGGVMSEPDDLPLDDADDGQIIELAAQADPLLAQWARFREQFKSAMTDGPGFWTIEDLEQKIAHRRAFFFPGKDAAMVAQIEVYPGGERVFQVLWAVGNVVELVSMAPGVESMGRMMGCTAMLIEGQPAWQRVLKDHGYKLWSVTLIKPL